MIHFSEKTPTIAQIYLYTYQNPHTWNRFDYAERDVLKTRIKITQRKVYRKNKEGKYSTPDELICLESVSTPQYYPYTTVKTKGAKKQRKIHHQYDCFFAFSKDENGQYTYQGSKIIFRIGSFKKWVDKPPQNQIKSVYRDTMNKLERKYRKLSPTKRKEMIRRDVEHIRKVGRYLDVGDWNSQVKGLNGDFVFRVAPLAEKYSCLYGRSYFKELPRDDYATFVFFPKHAISIINFLLKRGIIKYK